MVRNQDEVDGSMKQNSRHLEGIISVTKAFIQLDFFKMLQEVLNTIANMIRGEYGAIFLVHSGEVELVVHSGNPPKSLVKTALLQRIVEETNEGTGSSNSMGSAAQTVVEKRTLVFDDMSQLSVSKAAFKVIQNIGITNILSTPIIYHGQVLGVIQLSRRNNQNFNSQEVEVIESFGRELGLVITEKAALEAAEEARQDLEFFIDLFTHDISSQAMIIFSCLEELIEVVDQEDEDTQFYVKSASRSLQRIQTIIDQVRLLSTIKNLDIAELAPIDVCESIDRSIDAIKSMFSEEKLEIDIIRESCPIYIQGTTFLDNCLINLLQNAILADHNPIKKVKILLDLDEEFNTCRIEIMDHGEGIPDELKDKIFQRFFRARTKSKGSGLGLYITRSILGKFNGMISVKNRIKDDDSQGACFTVTLPYIDIEDYHNELV